MLLYYPQAVLPEMGPTAILPGSHYGRGTCFRAGMEFRPGSWADALLEKKLTFSEPGCCVLMHYSLWHRATGRPEAHPNGTSAPRRFMFKFQFQRVHPFGHHALPDVPR